MRSVLVLVRALAESPAAPESLPFGRAALALEAKGIGVSLGGLRAVPGGWLPDERETVAVYDRFPSETWPQEYQPPRGVPLENSMALQALCRDKLACHRVTGGPQIVTGDFQAALARWGSGFLKPRYGAFGRGVRFVRFGDDCPQTLPGSTGIPEPAILQRAVDCDCVAYRALVQREGDRWVCCPIVARRGTGPVVNVDRGAKAEPAGDRPLLEALALETARRLGGLELGVDLVVDRSGSPHVIEVNAKPAGRLEKLGPSFDEEHVRASMRPIQTLWGRYTS